MLSTQELIKLDPTPLNWQKKFTNVYSMNLLLLNNLSEKLKFSRLPTEVVDYKNDGVCIAVTANFISTILYHYLLIEEKK